MRKLSSIQIDFPHARCRSSCLCLVSLALETFQFLAQTINCSKYLIAWLICRFIYNIKYTVVAGLRPRLEDILQPCWMSMHSSQIITQSISRLSLQVFNDSSLMFTFLYRAININSIDKAMLTNFHSWVSCLLILVVFVMISPLL